MYRLPRQEMSREIAQFAMRKIKEDEVEVPRANAKVLRQLAARVRDIQTWGVPRHFVIKKLPGKIGHGVFLSKDAEPLLKGDVIGPYAGIVTVSPQNEASDSDYTFSLISDLHLTREEQILFDPKAQFHPRRLYSIDLDADKKGNFTRFINHASSPNVEAEMLEIPKNRFSLKPSPCEIIYLVKKKICPGEQLLVNYEGEDKSYWGALKIKPFPMTPRTFNLDNIRASLR